MVATLFALNFGVSELRVRSSWVRRLLEPDPTGIGRDGQWLLPELHRQGPDIVDVEAALREHGLYSVVQMKVVTLEIDGSINVVANDGTDTAESRRRRRRSRRFF